LEQCRLRTQHLENILIQFVASYPFHWQQYAATSGPPARSSSPFDACRGNCASRLTDTTPSLKTVYPFAGIAQPQFPEKFSRPIHAPKRGENRNSMLIYIQHQVILSGNSTRVGKLYTMDSAFPEEAVHF
jgi:hypothetical protein